MSVRSLAAAAALLAVAAAPVASQQATPAAKHDSLALSHQYIEWFYGGNVDSLRAHMTDGFRADMSSEALQRMIDMVAARAGMEQHVLEEKFVKRNGQTQYWRTAKFSAMDELFLIRWVIAPDGRLNGIGLGPADRAPPIDPS